MSLANMWALHFLWLIPLVVVTLVVHNRQKQRLLQRFAGPEFMDRLTGKDRRGRRVVKGLFLLTEALEFLLQFLEVHLFSLAL